jgi:sugar phosphate isomerase/epimerase
MKLAAQEELLPGRTLEERFFAAERIGFEGVELFGPGIRGRMKEIKDALFTVKVKVSTIRSGHRGELLSPNPEERERAASMIGDLLAAAAELGAVGVIVVPTFGGPKLPDLSPLYASVWELERALLVAELKELGRRAVDAGSYVLLEPLNRYETHFLNRLEQAVSIVEEVGSPGVAVMADFFHMNIEEASVPEALRLALKHLKHVHLADSNRWLPGFGHTDFREPFKVLKEGGYAYYMAMECHVPEPREENLAKSVRYLRSLMREG